MIFWQSASASWCGWRKSYPLPPHCPLLLFLTASPDWASNLKKSDIPTLIEQKTEERKYSILGGGDIGFPVLLAASVYFSRGFRDGIIVAVFA